MPHDITANIEYSWQIRLSTIIRFLSNYSAPISGVAVELCEWDAGALAKAHEALDVLALWVQLAAVCDYVPLRDLPEAGEMFAQFSPITWRAGLLRAWP